ncbi:ribosomal pseudouridine synthase D [Vibrio ishigakensis]|uniref:Ribosomal large subunit pseudouridine synthase D n=1 Tax=Vibrio ishigakensis TaxID=1481914 RepID=A0A0B8QEX3_9VIBR|nr:ribosomal pseudouridine synthase D [Vibrio ishigakensis]
MAQQIELKSTVNPSQLGQRLDQAVAELFDEFSRSRIKEWLLAGKISVDGQVITKPRFKVMGGEEIVVAARLKMKNVGKRKIFL